ncbi:MAG: hypothetical protein EA353_05930 [Puniceicoccaceae bacterium]|nr:MAG: hypothetical protein EA353_05930 [Puniceicoccaceae bacterium]
MHKTTILSFVAASLTSLTANAAINISFDTETLQNLPNGYVGGFYGSESRISLNQWFGGSGNISIADGVLKTNTDSGTRVGAYVFESSALSGAGEYELLFDITRFDGAPNNNGFVSIWSGSGYDLTNSSADALFIDTQTPTVTPQGNAIAGEITRLSIQNTVINESIAFTYDGTSALILFFGAQTSGFPFPQVDYDNIRVSQIPEPAIWLWLAPIAAYVLVKRRLRK